jgi:glycine/D-amino acid oxidase-like deaminating enzyme
MEGNVMQKSMAIIGAGPVGLAAAAHALERGLEPVVLEQGAAVADSVVKWGHVRLFSAWSHNIDAAASRLLSRYGWSAPDPSRYPTGQELFDLYLKPLADAPPVKSVLRLRHRVTSVGRLGLDKMKSAGRDRAPFEVEAETPSGPVSFLADAVIDASGTWLNPNPAGSNGYAAEGEAAHAGRIAYGMPDVRGAMRQRFAAKTTAVLGARHSAIGTLIDLVRLGEQVPGTKAIWLLRGSSPQKSFGGGDKDELAQRGALGMTFASLVEKGLVVMEVDFRVKSISSETGRLRISSRDRRNVLADELVVATGFRPDLSFLSELRLGLDPLLECPPALSALIDPNVHSCGTVPPHGAKELTLAEPGFYIAGMKSYGRAPTFLMMTGYEQVRSVLAKIAGDDRAAAGVELVLPETGVCGADEFYEGGCCRPPGLATKEPEGVRAAGG